MEDNSCDFDFMGNAILYGFIIFKCDVFYVYSRQMEDSMYFSILNDICI